MEPDPAPDRAANRLRRLSLAGSLGSAAGLVVLHGIHAAAAVAAGPVLTAAFAFACRIH